MNEFGNKGRSKPILLRSAKGFGFKEGIISDAGLLIEEGVIKVAGKASEITPPENAEVIDLGNATIMPGMIDAHMHLTGFRTGDMVKEPLLTPFGVLVARAIKDLEAIINAGFTTVKDSGSMIALDLREAVKEGTIKGPGIVAAGPPLTQTFGHADTHYLPVNLVDIRSSPLREPFGSLICDGEAECRKAARYAFRCGADYLKIMATGGVLSQRDSPKYRQFTREEIRAIVEEAEAVGTFVEAHAQGSEGIVNALTSGVKVIAHAIYIDEEGIQLAKEKGAIITPTFSIVQRIIEMGSEAGIPEWGLRKAEEVFRDHERNVRRAYLAGVKIATGTDFLGGVLTPHGTNAMELKMLVEKVGMTPQEALTAATKVAAEAAGLKGKVGELREGFIADVIGVKGDPTTNITSLLDPSNIVMVMKEGNILKKTFE